MSGAAMATPVTTLTTLNSNGTNVFAVYVFSEAGDTLNLSEIGPNSISNIFCNHSNGACTASTIGQTVYLGNAGPGIVFELTDITVPNTYSTNAFGLDGYAHDLVSGTVDAGDAAAVAAAYAIFGQGALNPAAAASIELLGQTPETMITFVGWEDRLGGDYDYNDLIFAFAVSGAVSDRVAVAAVPEPITMAMFAFGLAVLAGFRKRIHRA
jgi:hypothetical protein